MSQAEDGRPVAGARVSLFELSDLRQVSSTTTDAEGGFRLTLSSPSSVPRGFHLGQDYPNPFNPSTTIRFALPEGGHVRLWVLNVLGKRIRTVGGRV